MSALNRRVCRLPSKMKLLYLFLLVLCFQALSPVCQASRHKPKNNPAPTVSRSYVGSDTCIACHDDQSTTLEKTAHQKLLVEKDPAKNGCEACHGPGSEHVNGNGDAEKIFRFQGATPGDVNSHCGACHAALQEEHGHKQVSCLSCHSVHHASEAKAILVKSTPELCNDCHH